MLASRVILTVTVAFAIAGWLVWTRLFQRRKNLWWVIGSVLFIVAGLWLDWWAPKPQPAPTPQPCRISIAVDDEVIDRVHLRSFFDVKTHETGVYQAKFQDLFHDSIITLTPSNVNSRVIVTIQDMRKPTDTDIIRIEPPDDALISEAKPKWISGFEEPTHSPDYWVRTVTFSALKKVTSVTIRKPIKSHKGVNTIMALDLDLDRKVQTSTESDCEITTPSIPPYRARLDKLVNEIKFFVTQTVSGKSGTATRLDPDKPYPGLAINESELVEELKCEDSSCAKVTVRMIDKTRIH